MVAGGWYQLGSPFAQLDGKDTFTLNEAFPGFVDGDLLYMATEEGGYRVRYWKASNGNDGWSTSRNRYSEDATEYPQGMAVYICKKTAGTVILSGAVQAVSNSFGSENGNTWSLVALPWPEAKKLADYNWTGCADGDVLYLASPDGGVKARYWKVNASTGDAGWSTSRNAYRVDSGILEPGVAVYINKVSPGVVAVTK